MGNVIVTPVILENILNQLLNLICIMIYLMWLPDFFFFFLNVNKLYVVQLWVLIGPWVTCKPQASLHGFAWSVEPVSFGPIKSMTVTTPQGR